MASPQSASLARQNEHSLILRPVQVPSTRQVELCRLKIFFNLGKSQIHANSLASILPFSSTSSSLSQRSTTRFLIRFLAPSQYVSSFCTSWNSLPKVSSATYQLRLCAIEENL